MIFSNPVSLFCYLLHFLSDNHLQFKRGQFYFANIINQYLVFAGVYQMFIFNVSETTVQFQIYTPRFIFNHQFSYCMVWGCFQIFERPRIKRHYLHCEGSQWPNHHVRIQLYLFSLFLQMILMFKETKTCLISQKRCENSLIKPVKSSNLQQLIVLLTLFYRCHFSFFVGQTRHKNPLTRWKEHPKISNMAKFERLLFETGNFCPNLDMTPKLVFFQLLLA